MVWGNVNLRPTTTDNIVVDFLSNNLREQKFFNFGEEVWDDIVYILDI